GAPLRQLPARYHGAEDRYVRLAFRAIWIVELLTRSVIPQHHELRPFARTLGAADELHLFEAAELLADPLSLLTDHLTRRLEVGGSVAKPQRLPGEVVEFLPGVERQDEPHLPASCVRALKRHPAE